MKPMGRAYYMGKGGKHCIKSAGKAYAWWKDVCAPSKKRERQKVKKDIRQEVNI